MKTIVVGLTKDQRLQLQRVLLNVPPVDLPPGYAQLISFDVVAHGVLERCFDDQEDKSCC